MGIGNSDVEIKIVVDSSGAIKSINEVDVALEKTKESGEKSGSSLLNVFAAIEVGKAAFSAIKGTIDFASGAITELAQRGEKLGSLVDAFQNLGGQTKIIEEARERTLGLVSATDLYAIANNALVRGLPDVNKNFADIADLGARLADTLGKDTKPTIEQLFQAISTGKPIQLQQLGLFVDTDSVVTKYAKSQGIAAEQVSDLQKKQLIQNAVIEQARAKLKELAPVTDSVANAQESLGNSISDVKDRIGLAINSNSILAKSFRDSEKALNSIDWEAAGEAIGVLVAKVIELGTKISKFLIENIENFVRGLRILNELKNQIADFRFDYAGAVQAAAEAEVKAKKETEANAKAQEELGKQIEKTTGGKGGAGSGIVGQTKAVEELTNVSKFFSESILKQTLQVQLQAVADTFKRTTEGMQAAVVQVEAMRAAFVKGGGDIKVFEEALKGVSVTLEDKIATPAKGGGSIIDRVWDILNPTTETAQGADEAKQAIAETVADTISEGIGLAFDYLKGDEVTSQQLGEGVGSIIGAGIAASLSDSPAVAELGAKFGGEFGSFISGFFGGSTDTDTLVRRQIEEVIDTAISEANLQISNAQGKVIPFTDLILGDSSKFDADSEFNRFIESVPISISNAFLGTGQALAESLGQSFEQGGQVFAVILEQFGGSIDNLKLLVRTLDFTFEEAEEAMVKAFKAGKIGALETESKIRDFAAAFEPGLEGIGQTEKAFQNLIESGGRGEFAIKSLQDLAIEAVENGAKSLEDIRRQLIATGNYSVDEIDKVFSALNTSGVTTLEDLSNVSDRAAISILANLEAIGFGFAEKLDQAGAQLTEFTESFNNLPDGKEIDLKIKVTADYQNDGAREAFNAATNGQGIST